MCLRVAILRKGEILACDSLTTLQNKHTEPVVEVTLEDISRDVLEEIKALNFVVDCHREVNKLIIRLTSSAKSQELFSFLVQKSLKVREVKEVTKTLEDVYLTLVKESEE